MLAMALAHRGARRGQVGGWRSGPARQPPGLCTILAALALILVMVGASTLGVERAAAAIHNTRGGRILGYNAVARAWGDGGSDRFAQTTRGFEARVNGFAVSLFPKNGTGGFVQADIADPRKDLTRTPTTHMLYARIARTIGTSLGDEILRPPEEKITVTISAPNGDGTENGRKVPSADASRAARFAPFQCHVWSLSRSSVRDRVDCDACELGTSDDDTPVTRCAAACDNTEGRRKFIAQRHWVRSVALVVEDGDEEEVLEDGDVVSNEPNDESAGGSSPTNNNNNNNLALPLQNPTVARCAFSYHSDVVSREEWRGASDVRSFCASLEGKTPPGNTDIALNVRSSIDPFVVAGEMTKCGYDFGSSAGENASSAIFLLALAFLCVIAAAYWGRAKGACGVVIQRDDDELAWRENRSSHGSGVAAVNRSFSQDTNAGARAQRTTPARAYYVTDDSVGTHDVYAEEVQRRETRRGSDRSRRDRRSGRERNSGSASPAAVIVELAEVRRGGGGGGGGRPNRSYLPYV